METVPYNKKISDAIQDVLEGGNWKYDFDEINGMFTLTFGSSHGLNYDMLILTGEKDFETTMSFPVGTERDDLDLISTMAEFICLVNYERPRSLFFYHPQRGEIRYRERVKVNPYNPEKESVLASLVMAIGEIHSITPGILAILFQGATAEEALAIMEAGHDLVSSFMNALEHNATAEDVILSDETDSEGNPKTPRAFRYAIDLNTGEFLKGEFIDPDEEEEDDEEDLFKDPESFDSSLN